MKRTKPEFDKMRENDIFFDNMQNEYLRFKGYIYEKKEKIYIFEVLEREKHLIQGSEYVNIQAKENNPYEIINFAKHITTRRVRYPKDYIERYVFY